MRSTSCQFLPLAIPRILLCLLVVAAGLIVSAYGAPGASPTSSDSERVTQQELQSLRATPDPLITARSAVVVDGRTGRVLWNYNGAERQPMASTTKMMTALLAVELAEPDELVTVYPRDLVGGSSILLREGEQLTIEQLLYGALIASGNDAAYAIADHVGREHLGGVGDEGVDAFIDAMNERASELGMNDTHFKNPNGFDEEGHYSTALDLAILGRQVLRDPLLSEIVRTQKYRVTGYMTTGRERIPVHHPVETTNDLLGAYRGASGIKTGTTPAAGEALVASARRGPSELIAVVLGSTDRFSDTSTLFDWGYATHTWLPLYSSLFAPALSRSEQAPEFAAVRDWNADMTFRATGEGATTYWAATVPLAAGLDLGSRP